MIRMNYQSVLFAFLLLLLGNTLYGQANYDLEVQMEMPDTLIAGDSIVVSGYIKNHGPAPYWGIDVGVNFSIEQEMIFDAPIPDFLASLIEPYTFIAVNDSVLFTNTMYINPNEFELDDQNIVIVWPTDNTVDLDPANDYWVKEVFVEDPHDTIIQFIYEGEWEDIVDPEIFEQTAKDDANELVLPSKLLLYPQPCSDVLYLEGPVALEQIRIIDASGRVLVDQAVYSARNTINTSGLNNGIYLMELKSGLVTEYERILVHH